MNLKYIFEILLIFAGVFYYYIATLFQENLSLPLLVTTIVGTVLAGVIVVRHLLVRKLTKFSFKFICLFLLVFVSAYFLGWPNVSWIALMATPLLSIDRDKYIKIIFFSSAFMFALTVFLSLRGILPLEYVGFSGEVEERYGSIKYSLGFDGPNQAAFAFFAVILSGMYSYGARKVFAIGLTLATIAVGLAAGSRTGALCSLLFIVSFLAIQKKKDKRSGRIFSNLFIICATISFGATVFFAGNQVIDEVTTGRLTLINQYLNSEYIPTLFGNDAVYNKADYQTPPLDNFTMYVLGKYGLVGFGAFALLFYVAIRREFSPKIRTMFFFIMLYGLTEAFFDVPAKNFLLPIFLYSFVVKPDKRKTI